MQKQTYSCVNTPQPDLIKLIEGFGDFYMNYKNIDPPKSICSIIREYLESINMQPQPDILQAAIKLRLHLEAEKDIPKTNWKKGDRLELENNVFDKNTGIAFIPLDLGWKVNGVEILESDPQPDYAKMLEEKDEAIRELVADLEQLNYWVNSENTKNLITKYKQP